MSDELKAAAQSLWEQILQYSQGPMPTSPELARDSVGRAMEIIRQTVVILGAYLSAREGDELPVTNEWLVSLGGQQEMNPIKVTFNRGENQDIGLWRVDDGWKAMLIHAPHAASQMIRGLTTRGQVLALLEALGISTKEPQ